MEGFTVREMASSDSDNQRDISAERRSNSGERQSSREREREIDELATRSLRIQSKRYYVDVKQNARGKFIKLVEGLPDGTKNRLSFPMSIVPDVRDKLTSFADFYGELEPASQREATEDGNLKKDDIRSNQRKIYFDLKENKRGVFLRISSTASFGGRRQTIALPAQGIIDVRNVLTEFIDEFGGDEEEPLELPDFQEMRVERKRFYFDCGSNDRGSFVRISEVTSKYRSSVTVPKQGLHKFRELLGDIIDKMEKV